MARSKIIAFIGIAISLLAIAILSTSTYNRNSLNAQIVPKQEYVGGHTPGYPIIQTNADLLDPTSSSVNPKSAVVDPMKYLREFNYGRISKLPNGTTVREFTLIASDQKVRDFPRNIL